MHTYKTEIELCGVEVEVIVHYKITSYGTADSYTEPGDPPELEVHDVVSVLRGVSYYDLLDKSPAFPIVLSPSYRADDRVTDPVRCALFGRAAVSWEKTPANWKHKFTHFPERLQFGSSMLDKLIDETYEQEAFEPDYDWDSDRGYHL